MDEFVPCTNSPGSCGLCLLDYDVTISRVDHGSGWKVKIEAYHQLGDCRSPDDWKWARFTEKARPHLFLPNRPNRRGSGYNPGSVKRRWLQGAPELVVDSNIDANFERAFDRTPDRMCTSGVRQKPPAAACRSNKCLSWRCPAATFALDAPHFVAGIAAVPTQRETRRHLQTDIAVVP